MTRPATNSTRRKGTVRCAIYTRKSSEEGLEQEFNSLQAQREACEAFITSQRHEGWRIHVCRLAGTRSGPCSALLESLRSTSSPISPRPEATRPRLRASAGTVANHIGGIAVLEYGRVEIFPPVGAISSRHACLWRPRRLPRPAHPREKPGFWVWDGEIPRDTDFPLEGKGFEPSVPPKKEEVIPRRVRWVSRAFDPASSRHRACP